MARKKSISRCKKELLKIAEELCYNLSSGEISFIMDPETTLIAAEGILIKHRESDI